MELQRLSQLPARQRLDGLLASPEAQALVRAMPPEQLYTTVVEVGLADAAEVVQLASPEQFQAQIRRMEDDALDPTPRWSG
jgi:hypothetical protein